jgi:hypothetical protein
MEIYFNELNVQNVRPDGNCDMPFVIESMKIVKIIFLKNYTKH